MPTIAAVAATSGGTQVMHAMSSSIPAAKQGPPPDLGPTEGFTYRELLGIKLIQNPC